MTPEQAERQTQALEAIASYLQVLFLHFQETTAARFDDGFDTLAQSRPVEATPAASADP